MCKSLITSEDAINAIYSPIKTSYVNSNDPVQRIYNKKGFRLALLDDNSSACKLALEKFFNAIVKSAWE